jgi:hypothetical protein
MILATRIYDAIAIAIPLDATAAVATADHSLLLSSTLSLLHVMHLLLMLSSATTALP